VPRELLPRVLDQSSFKVEKTIDNKRLFGDGNILTMYARCITINWEGVASAIGLDAAETAELFADGRVSGELLQRVATRQFQLTPSNNCDLYDALFPLSQQKIEIRLITRHGLQTCPSNQVGAKREFNHDLYLEKLNLVEYFLFLDLRTVSNTIPCYLIPSSIILKFYTDKILNKQGATSSYKTIAKLLMESTKDGWEELITPPFEPITVLLEPGDDLVRALTE